MALRGTHLADLLIGKAAADRINGLGGNDTDVTITLAGG
jgi:hypothetical protein